MGYNQGAISNTYATGRVIGPFEVGGPVGVNDAGGTVTLSWASGTVIGPSYSTSGDFGESGPTQTGGLVGLNASALVISPFLTIPAGSVTNSYWDTYTSGQQAGIGENDGTSSGVSVQLRATRRNRAPRTMLYNRGAYSAFTFDSAPGGTGFVIVDADGTLNGANGATRPFGTREYTQNIVNSHQLQLMALGPTASYTLGASIDLSADLASTVNPLSPIPANLPNVHPGMWGAAGFVPIGNGTTPFSGSFNGQGNYIANLTIDTPNNSSVGLFGVASGSISNVGLIDAMVTGFSQTGAFVGSLIQASSRMPMPPAP